jgi:hypothetical protein
MKKSITFEAPSPLPRTRDATEYVFPYAIVDSSLVGTPEERSRTSSFSIRVGGTGSLISCWDFEEADLIRVLFEYGKRHVIQKLKDGALSDKEELLLSTSTAEIPCPFDPSRIPNLAGATIEVDLVGAPIMEDQSFLQLASSIIDARDNINAIFSSVHKERLILVTEERDLLQFFRDASSQEEFFFRLCALANAATALNVAILRNISGISDPQVKSISLLEEYLKGIGTPSPRIIKTLRYINRIRQGYPVHGNRVEGVLEAHKFFNLEYPVVDFSNSWKNLLINYFNALKMLLDLIKEKANPSPQSARDTASLNRGG